MRLILLLAALPIVTVSQTTKENFKSGKTGDTYVLIIKKPGNFNPTKAYHHVYFADAGINSGKTILSRPDDSIKNCILIGIAHKGDWDTKRLRDFIPSDAGGYSDDEFGMASKFYLFIYERRTDPVYQ